MKRKIYIYQNNLDTELILFFQELNDQILLESVEDNVIELIDKDYYNEEPIDLENIEELLTEDFDSKVTIIIEPYLEEEFMISGYIKAFVKELPSGVYYFEDIITYAVLKDKKELKNSIKEFISCKANNEVIHTVKEFIENNMNSSVSAKKLFMHRNTLNYRVDNFIDSTNINVKTFKGANAFYMLYKY